MVVLLGRYCGYFKWMRYRHVLEGVPEVGRAKAKEGGND